MVVLILTDSILDGENGVGSYVLSGCGLDQCGDDDEGFGNHSDAQNAVRAVKSRNFRYLDRFES